MNRIREYLFVYGTLMSAIRTGTHDPLEESSILIDCGLTQGRLYAVGSYPGLVFSDNSTDRVIGEVYAVSDPNTLFSGLDRYEECAESHPEPHEYRRTRVSATTMGGRSISAWTYVYNLPVHNLSVIQSGDYLEFLGLRGKQKAFDHL